MIKNNRIENRKTYIDILRIFACMCVIFNHCEGYELFKDTQGVMKCFYSIFSMFSSIGVPIFFIISGLLLLNRKENYAVVYKKRIVRIFVVLLFVLLGMYTLNIFKSIYKNEYVDFQIVELIRSVLSLEINGALPYWYLFSYIGFLFALPLLQKLVSVMNEDDFKILILLRIIFGVAIFAINDITSSFDYSFYITEYFSIPLVMVDSIFYPLLGYYLEYFVDVDNISIFKILVINFIVISVSIIFAYLYNDIVCFRLFLSTIIFINVKKGSKSIDSNKLKTYIYKISELTFGIYLLDPFLYSTIKKPIYSFIKSIFSSMFSSIIWVFLSMVIGGFITVLLKKIPKINELL